MVPVFTHRTSITPSSLLASSLPHLHTHHHFPLSPLPLRRPQTSHYCSLSSSSNASEQSNEYQPFFRSNPQPLPLQKQQQPRTLFPGGYKRPEIKVPTLVLQIEPEEVLGGGDGVDALLGLIDRSVSKWVGIVVLGNGGSSGGRLYEAACALKSLLRDRAYLLVAERVDIAAAAGASGVLLSDQGLPTVVARKTMLDANSESVVLPLVARIVQTVEAAVNASKSEGADFLIYGSGDLKQDSQEVNSVYGNVKIPIFVSSTHGKNMSYAEASSLLASGASGFVTSLDKFGAFDDDFLRMLFDKAYANDKISLGNLGSNNSELKMMNSDNGFQSEMEVVSGFSKLEDRERQLIKTEKSVLSEAIEVIKKAAPLVIF